MSSRFVTHLTALALWVIAVMVCVAWLSSVLMTSRTDPNDADYLWRPLEMGGVARGALGVAAAAITVAVAVVLRRRFTQGGLSRNWLAAFITGAMIAAYFGLTYTVVTAPVIGANIGGGFMILFAGPFVVATVIAAVVFLRSSPRASTG